MVPKRATFISYGTDDSCAEARKFIEDSGVLLRLRDLAKNPLTVYELEKLIGHTNIGHFLDTLSESYAKHKLDQNSTPRAEIIKLMAEDHTLIRRPIIQSARLTTVGCDKAKIAQMLQISLNGSGDEESAVRNGNRRHHSRPKDQAAAARK